MQVEGCLEARHIDYRFEPSFAIGEVVDSDGHQVRLIENQAPSNMVTRYAQQMKTGAVFPAIVVSENGELIDGNTRRRAAVKAGRSTIPTYICRGLTRLEARSLSVELNQSNGLAMSEPEIHAFIRGAVQEGQTLDTRACARMTGVRPATLDRWKAQAQFELRANQYGIATASLLALSDSVQAALGGIRLRAALVEATDLAVAARLSASDVRALVARVNGAPSESAALEIVADERHVRGDRIKAFANGFAPRANSSHRSAMHVAALLKIDVTDMLDVRPERREEAIARLRALRDHVDRALGAVGKLGVAPRHADTAQMPSRVEVGAAADV